MTNFADRTIWTGDNLDILRGINSDSVDLIYLDPPFNSNRNYAAPVGSSAAGAAFKDTWTLSDLDVAWMGLIADEQPAMYKVLEAAGLTHGKGMQSYLCMMAVRLLEMRRVLKDSGSIYLHCDPTASHYLKLLMDSVFGSGLFLNEMTWKRSSARPAYAFDHHAFALAPLVPPQTAGTAPCAGSLKRPIGRSDIYAEVWGLWGSVSAIATLWLTDGGGLATTDCQGATVDERYLRPCDPSAI